MKTKRVLLLTADAGFGHRRAAQAIEAALHELYDDRCEVEVVNPLDDADAPELIRQLEEGYDEFVVEDPALYRLAYHALDAPVVSDLAVEIAALLLNDLMVRIVERGGHDVIVSTYPTYAQPIARALRKTKRDVPLAVVVTDLTEVVRFWYSRAATMHFLPTPQTRDQAYRNNIPATRVKVTGLPVSPSFARESRDAAELRAELGWEQECPTALIVASVRTRRMATISRMLDRSGLGLQLAVVCGGEESLFRSLQEEDWQGPVHLYEWVDTMPQLMKAADFIVTKAGGLIVSEALACGLPLIIPEALPGQEVGNVKYVIAHGAGAWAPGPAEVLVTAHSWLKDSALRLQEVRAHACELGKPQAAFHIAEGVYGLA